MSGTVTEQTGRPTESSHSFSSAETVLTAGQLPKFTDVGLFVIAVCVSAAVLALMGSFNLAGALVLGVVIFLVCIYALSFAVEGRRRAANRLARYIIFGAFVLALIPLVSLLVEVTSRGLARFDLDYFTMSKRNIVGDGGGASHAITGTLIVTGIATVVSVPVGLLTAIYLVEYGKGWVKRTITFLVDVMTGIPSIVAGLFAYGLFAVLFSPGSKSGLAGAVALSVLMIPYVVRSSEEIIRLVPNSLREASYALGVTRWRTILKVVLPTSISGIVSGVILAIARVIGETAPLLVTMGFTDSLVTNPLPGGGANDVNPMTSLPVFVYYEYTRPGKPQDAFFDRAWTGALVLVLIVMALNIVGRIVAKKFAPKLNR
ncbi:phosphate ABC transporter permease PstA [Propionimicrobium sp. PCR01-08-3]|uniref:phosphate ABC transporter permease PstA n=1 Tax=Propionimicrobium sp. PCR01-08-3 TaxID=3052086 RepID=UPI00255C4DF5|nr:phosphate ABC transporter permease PstA [Propionimicrobium sp. PCR01-08-3]WIY82011.1 phosphate ABC transporter permease PstA [Propionimicrobium sp. PCR01-08-3]